MTPHDPYEAWKRRRADVPVPPDFADRVLAGLRRQRGLSLLRARAARIGLGSLAGAVCLFRILQFVALFLTGGHSTP
jgi:hypothetical protein